VFLHFHSEAPHLFTDRPMDIYTKSDLFFIAAGLIMLAVAFYEVLT
jgi:hypothetical protein